MEGKGVWGAGTQLNWCPLPSKQSPHCCDLAPESKSTQFQGFFSGVSLTRQSFSPSSFSTGYCTSKRETRITACFPLSPPILLSEDMGPTSLRNYSVWTVRSHLPTDACQESKPSTQLTPKTKITALSQAPSRGCSWRTSLRHCNPGKNSFKTHFI